MGLALLLGGAYLLILLGVFAVARAAAIGDRELDRHHRST